MLVLPGPFGPRGPCFTGDVIIFSVDINSRNIIGATIFSTNNSAITSCTSNSAPSATH